MAKFVQSNFESCAIALLIDMNAALNTTGAADWIETIGFPAVGGFAHECGGFHTLDESKPTVPGSLGGISFAQWTGMGAKNGRRGQFMAFCRKRRLHPYSYAAALGMIVAELRGPEKRAIERTASARVKENTPKPKDIMMARVVAFEASYERAGVKHYPSRYTWAMRVRDAWMAWNKAGCPALKPWVSPGGGFSAAFDREFGPIPAPKPGQPFYTSGQAGLIKATVITARYDDEVDAYPVETEASPIELAPPRPPAPIEPDPYGAILPPVRVVAGRWNEANLTPAEIMKVQNRMRDLGWVQTGKVDGKWSEGFISAMQRFQRKAGIADDGHWGSATRTALGVGVKFEPPIERTMTKEADLIKAKEPTTTAAASIKTTSWLTGAGGALTVVFSALSEYAGDAWQWVSAARQEFDAVPMWMVGAAIVAVSVFLYMRGRRIARVRVEEERSGANTALATPVLPEGLDVIDLPGTAPWSDTQRPTPPRGGSAVKPSIEARLKLAQLRAAEQALRDQGIDPVTGGPL